MEQPRSPVESRKPMMQRPEELENENPEKEEEEDYTVETVDKLLLNIRIIRSYYYRLKFEFIIVILLYSYESTCSYFLKNGDCGMTSLHAILYMYTINSSCDNLVPVNNATTQHCADLFINL